MDPSRKRRIRLVVALSAALLLASALIYTSFSASPDVKEPSQLAAAKAGETIRLTGEVVEGTVRDIPGGKTFRLRDHDGSTVTVPVRYVGAIPDPFREGRGIVVTVKREGSLFEGERDTLTTKCPSKFTEKKTQDS